MDSRLKKLHGWLTDEVGLTLVSLEAASADASFRRYFRALTPEQSYIAMDAPPSKEDCRPFVQVAEQMISGGVHAPTVYASNLSQGFILLEDLGSVDYLSELQSTDIAETLYRDALSALNKIQSLNTEDLSQYDALKLGDELDLFIEWYLGRHLSIELNQRQQATWQATRSLLISKCEEQPQVAVHRDYHSRNLMVTDQNNPGVIDFQDMVVGPISYDLASLFKDCYIEWPRSQQLIWLQAYFDDIENPNFTVDQLIRWYDFTGLQRHLKVLGIFCRLNYRDGKPRYLEDLPLVANYILEVLDRYSELFDFKTEFAGWIRLSQ